MPEVILPIANGFYMADSLPISAQECTNWYPYLVEAPALSQETLLGTPGVIELASTGTVSQVNRGSWVLNGIPYFVNGDSLYKLERTIVDSLDTFAVVNIGTIAGTGRVSLADNGTQLCILSPGGKGYIFTADPDTLTEITDPDFRANGEPQHVVFLDGYFVFTTDGKKFIVSALNNGLAYNALDFGTAEADPDAVVVPIVFRNQLFITGTSTAEAFQNIGGADFPFQRTGLFIQKGVSAPFSAIGSNDTFMFVGSGKNESPAIWSLQGNTVTKVSTTAIDSMLQPLTDLEVGDIFAYSYAQDGAYFVAFALPETTLVIDTITGRWHERKSQITDAKNVTTTERSRVNSLVTAYGRVIVGDMVDGRIGEMSPDVLKEYGTNIIRRISTQPFQNNMKPFFVSRLELTMESGVGNTDVPSPQVRMDRSTNGGKTFGYDRSRSIGKKGEYHKRTIWRRLGRASRLEIFRFTLSDAVKPVVIQLTANIEGA